VADASRIRQRDEITLTAAAAVAVGEVRQLADGRAGVFSGSSALQSGSSATHYTDGHFTFVKTSGVVLLDGDPAYWDHSANAVTYKPVNDRDFLLGSVIGDAASGDTTVAVNLNEPPRWDVDLLRTGFNSLIVGTPAAGGFGYPLDFGGSLVFELTATNEAQKVDALSVDGWATGANAIVRGVFRVTSDGAGTTPDLSIGIANGTDSDNADDITESVFIHLDGNGTPINVESDDGTTEVAATDTTLDYTEGSEVANRVYFTIDMRNPADVQVYVNGALVLGSTVFNVSAATGPWRLLVHLEKTASTDTYRVAVDELRARFAEQ
jgi:predicted RecA/RadA family phage recombinase